MKHQVTDLARNVAKLHGLDKSDLLSRSHDEILQLMEDGLTHPSELFFHTFEMNDTLFMVRPVDDDTMLIDTATLEDNGIVTEAGPLKGKSILMPRPDSLEDDE